MMVWEDLDCYNKTDVWENYNGSWNKIPDGKFQMGKWK
jgi:hypothetical protein